MAEWKKVVVSGSSAELSNLNVDSAVTASAFKGDGSALTNIAAGSINHDSLAGYVANEHIDHTSVEVTAGAGLTGGGNIAATRTINVVGGDGITANADDIAVDATVLRTTGGGVISGSAQITLAGALMDSELTDLAGVKGVTISTLQPKPSEGAFADGDKTKLDAIEASADVTDTTNVTAAGALMDSELTDLAGVKGVTISTLQSKPSEGAFANGDKTKLDGIEASADVTDSTNVLAALSGQDVVLGAGDLSATIISGSSVKGDGADLTNLTFANITAAEEGIEDIVNGLIVGGSNVTATYDDAAGTLTIDADLAGDIEGVTAGAGLTGGGTTGSPTVNIGAGSGITVNADDIQVDATVLRTTGGAIHSGSAQVSSSLFNKDLNIGTGNITATVISGSAIQGNGAGLTNIPNSGLTNSSVSLGGVTVALGASDATPAFDLADATGYLTSNLSGTITNAQLGGSISNDKLAGSIANGKLANSSVTVGAATVALGSSATAAAILAGSGVLSGSATAESATSSSFASNAASADAVADNSVVLGTSTTGAFVSALGSGTGVTIGSNSGEASSPTIAVNYGSTANTAVQGNATATFTGTANEITVSNSAAQAIGGNIAVTIGLPDNVTIAGTGSVNGDLSVAGNLAVGGDLTYVNSTDLVVQDPFILLNSGSNGATQGDSGIIFGGADGTINSGNLLFWDKSYNGNDGRLSIKNGFAHTTTGNPTPDYAVAGVFEGSAANAATAQADHVGNIRVESEEIYIYV